MQYKGYAGRIEIDEDAGIIFGQVMGLRDVIAFQGKTVEEARKALKESVDEYLRFCKEKGQSPEKPYSGKFLVRIKTSLHRELANLAEARNQSLNTLVEQLLEQGVRETQHGLAKRPALGRPARRA
jgi:predicted HicB family RNase H-like nuclease